MKCYNGSDLETFPKTFTFLTDFATTTAKVLQSSLSSIKFPYSNWLVACRKNKLYIFMKSAKKCDKTSLSETSKCLAAVK